MAKWKEDDKRKLLEFVVESLRNGDTVAKGFDDFSKWTNGKRSAQTARYHFYKAFQLDLTEEFQTAMSINKQIKEDAKAAKNKNKSKVKTKINAVPQVTETIYGKEQFIAETAESEDGKDIHVKQSEFVEYYKQLSNRINVYEKLRVGKKLEYIKEQLGHGNYREWIDQNNINYSFANRALKVYTELAKNNFNENEKLFESLTFEQLFAYARIPSDKRAEKLVIDKNGTKKSILDMTSREIDAARKLLSGKETKSKSVEKSAKKLMNALNEYFDANDSIEEKFDKVSGLKEYVDKIYNEMLKEQSTNDNVSNIDDYRKVN